MLSCRVLQCLGPINNLIVEGYSKTVPPMRPSNYVLWSELFRKYLNYQAEAFFQNVQNFM